MPSEAKDAERFHRLSGAFVPRRPELPRLAATWQCEQVMTTTDYERICAFESLFQAHRRARLGKRSKSEVIAFEMNLAASLWTLREGLLDGSYMVSGYHRFKIYEPKEREVQALGYADRVVQHSLCDNVLTPFFDKRLIYDNCACRVGKGTHFGVDRLEGFMRAHYREHGPEGWILKADVRKYFASIDHTVLLERLRGVIPDADVMRLLDKIVTSHNVGTGKGLPLGNQTSQLFALYYLDPLDRLVKEKLRVRHYTRYMDDMVLLHPDREYLRMCEREMRKFAEERLQLALNDKTQISPMRNGVDYLGWHHYLTETGRVVRKLRAGAKRRIWKRLGGLKAAYGQGKADWTAVQQSMAATYGHLKHGDTYRLRARIYREAVFTKNEGART